MPTLFRWALLPFILFLAACGKTTPERSRLYNFSANPSYSGTHPTGNLSASLYVRDRSTYLEFQTDLKGVVDSLEYTARIHEADTSATYGYKPLATMNLGTYKTNIPVITHISGMDFSTFAGSFKGYFIIQDPLQPAGDTTSLLFFGKVGGGWE